MAAFRILGRHDGESEFGIPLLQQGIVSVGDSENEKQKNSWCEMKVLLAPKQNTEKKNENTARAALNTHPIR